jgi:hypothetical protein
LPVGGFEEIKIIANNIAQCDPKCMTLNPCKFFNDGAVVIRYLFFGIGLWVGENQDAELIGIAAVSNAKSTEFGKGPVGSTPGIPVRANHWVYGCNKTEEDCTH